MVRQNENVTHRQTHTYMHTARISNFYLSFDFSSLYILVYIYYIAYILVTFKKSHKLW